MADRFAITQLRDWYKNVTKKKKNKGGATVCFRNLCAWRHHVRWKKKERSISSSPFKVISFFFLFLGYKEWLLFLLLLLLLNRKIDAAGSRSKSALLSSSRVGSKRVYVVAAAGLLLVQSLSWKKAKKNESDRGWWWYFLVPPSPNLLLDWPPPPSPFGLEGICLLATWMKSYLLWPYPHDYTGKSTSCSLLWLDRTHYYLFIVLSIQLFKVKAQSNS